MLPRDNPEHRFFFALLPPVQLARLLATTAPWFDATGRQVRADRLHVTLFILDDVATYIDDLVRALREVGDRLAAAPVEMLLDRAVGSDTSVALRPSRTIGMLSALRRQLVEVARAAGIAQRHHYRSAPHLTLGYRCGTPFEERIKPVVWRADEVVLIHSLLGRTRHEVLGRWPLTGAVARQFTLF